MSSLAIGKNTMLNELSADITLTCLLNQWLEKRCNNPIRIHNLWKCSCTSKKQYKWSLFLCVPKYFALCYHWQRRGCEELGFLDKTPQKDQSAMFEDLEILQIKSQIFEDLESLKTKPQKMSHFVSLGKMGKGSSGRPRRLLALSSFFPLSFFIFFSSHSSHILFFSL